MQIGRDGDVAASAAFIIEKMDAPNKNLTANCELDFDAYTDRIREATVLYYKDRAFN